MSQSVFTIFAYLCYTECCCHRMQAHEDGPAYFPAASIVSLGSSAVMHFRRKNDEGTVTTCQLFVAVQHGAYNRSMFIGSLARST